MNKKHFKPNTAYSLSALSQSKNTDTKPFSNYVGSNRLNLGYSQN